MPASTFSRCFGGNALPSLKTVRLGVIVLAHRLLQQLQIQTPRFISAAATALAVSRKTGYKAADCLYEQLIAAERERGPDDERAHDALEHRIALLELRVQVLTYERDHRGLRFAKRKRHLPQQAKSFCVRLLRDFRERLRVDEIVATIGVAASSLARWDREADSECRFPEKGDRRGKERHHRQEDEERVVALWKSLDESTSLAEFAARYQSEHADRPLDPKTIGRILVTHGLKPLEATPRAPPYRDKFEVHFPGAQAAIDATESKIRFVGSDGEETITLKEEVAIDIASGAILGTALRKQEDSEGVERVVVAARAECAGLLAVLADNGPANASGAVRRAVEEATSAGPIFTFPFHPWTNGHIEGHFGQFKRIVGAIEIDDTTRESTARSVLRTIRRVYEHFHNYSPRRRLGGLGPIEYLRRYTPLPEEVETARRELRKREERCQKRYETNPRLEDEEFRALVARILSEHRIEQDFERALGALVRYDTAVIESAKSAFLVASAKDGFDERKRTFAYFRGIVARKQKEVDEGRLRGSLDSERMRRQIDSYRRHDREVERARAQEIDDATEQPERVILTAAKLLLSGGLRLMRKTFLEKLRTGLVGLERLGRNTRAVIEALALEISAWSEYGEELKGAMVELLAQEARSTRAEPSRARTSPAAARDVAAVPIR